MTSKKVWSKPFCRQSIFLKLVSLQCDQVTKPFLFENGAWPHCICVMGQETEVMLLITVVQVISGWHQGNFGIEWVSHGRCTAGSSVHWKELFREVITTGSYCCNAPEIVMFHVLCGERKASSRAQVLELRWAYLGLTSELVSIISQERQLGRGKEPQKAGSSLRAASFKHGSDPWKD